MTAEICVFKPAWNLLFGLYSLFVRFMPKHTVVLPEDILIVKKFVQTLTREESSVRTREYYNVTTPGFFVRDTIFNQKASAMMLGGSIIRNGQEYPHIELVPFDKCCNTAQ